MKVLVGGLLTFYHQQDLRIIQHLNFNIIIRVQKSIREVCGLFITIKLIVFIIIIVFMVQNLFRILTFTALIMEVFIIDYCFLYLAFTVIDGSQQLLGVSWPTAELIIIDSTITEVVVIIFVRIKVRSFLPIIGQIKFWVK